MTLPKPSIGTDIKIIAAVLAAGLLSLGVVGGANAEGPQATPTQWPFHNKIPPDPALGLLNKIDGVKVTTTNSDPKLITITVTATAPRPGYSDLTLVDKPGPLNDLTFAFEARGRPPQKPSTKEQQTSVTLGGTYSGAPIAKIKKIELYAADNCIAYSVPDGATSDCTTRMPDEQVPQDQTP